jgi:hypothetical protein
LEKVHKFEASLVFLDRESWSEDGLRTELKWYESKSSIGGELKRDHDT